ncbi:hypothetical protein VTN77DRAFT_4821 [Rasamsonia byssochlamydoides]|uniref:uncharacterized protein n=1 Tax=Rasamsonia byssochlamydoides TaxID=89139 RepID=UPI003741F006
MLPLFESKLIDPVLGGDYHEIDSSKRHGLRAASGLVSASFASPPVLPSGSSARCSASIGSRMEYLYAKPRSAGTVLSQQCNSMSTINVARLSSKASVRWLPERHD